MDQNLDKRNGKKKRKEKKKTFLFDFASSKENKNDKTNRPHKELL